jgi:nitrite reductase/ring-hydroxylating ferredoxin subunit
MLSREDNDLLTRTGPGTPGGDFMRRYWHPVALAEELPAGGAPLPVRILGENLTLFRDEQGRVGLLGLHCAHRGADLSYGRIEDGGLRCLYHGWLYDINGRCLEQPGEPAGSTFHTRMRQLAYPCQERAGMIFTYLGPGDPPLLPAYEFLDAPPERRFVVKIFQECNYLQANEGNLDQAHLSFLHKDLSAPRDGLWSYLLQDTSPLIDPEETDFGLRVYSVRRLGPDKRYVRLSNLLLPHASAFPTLMQDGYQVHYHVPIDDAHHWKYVYLFERACTPSEEYVQCIRGEMAPGHRLARSPANRYLQDRESMQTSTFSGLGSYCFQSQDACVTEGAGPIQDRTQEHLGATDKAVIATRRLLLRAIREVQAGREPPHVVRDPAANRFPHLVATDFDLPASADWRTYWKTPAAPQVGTEART